MKKIFPIIKSKNFVITALLAFVLFEGLTFAQIKFPNLSTPGQNLLNNSIEQYADRVIAICAESNYRPACYDKEIPQLMQQISMEDAFKVTSVVQSKDKVYAYCHVLGHELSAREVDKNPSKWKDVIRRVPSGMCSNGGIHGAMQQRFRSEKFTAAQTAEIKPELNDLCEEGENWHPTGLEQGSCYHALGHLTMYLTDANINQSIAICDEVAKKPDGRDLSQLCYDGSFMQIFQPLEPEDFDLIKGKEVAKADLQKFCAKYSGPQRGSCWSEGWPLYRDELLQPSGLTAYCNKSIPPEVDRCFMSLQYVLAAQFNLDSEKILSYCPSLEKNRVGDCFGTSASRMIEVDYRNIEKAVDLCLASEKYDNQSKCFSTLLLYSTYNYHPGSDEFYRVCNSFPNIWKDKCLKQI